jgi:glycosyltransferase involved in cell wall biosynthesis
MPAPIVYIAASFPARSETFVYREVRELRRRGWSVKTVSLNGPDEPGLAEFADLESGNVIVYGTGGGATVRAAISEFLAHPIRALRTFFTAATDALSPAEPMPLSARLKLPGQALAAIGAARRVAGASPNHIHAHFAHAPATVAMYMAMQLKIPWSFTGHANDLFQRRALLTRKLARVNFVACISEWHRSFYISAGADAAKCHVIRCGVPVSEWTPREIDHTCKQINLLTVCRLVEKKGVDTLLRAAAQFDHDWRLTIAGDGPESDKLKTLAAQLGIANRCEFLGAVSNECVRDLLMHADYFVLPCRTDARGDRDGIPVVLMEAMACGVPVISGDLPAIRELIEHGVSGMLVDGANSTDVANALEELERDETFRKRVSCAGRKRVESEFSLEENVTRLEQLLWHGHLAHAERAHGQDAHAT